MNYKYLLSAIFCFASINVYASDFRVIASGNGSVSYVDFEGIFRKPSGLVSVIINSVRAKPIRARKPGTFAQYGRFSILYNCTSGVELDTDISIYDGGFALVDEISPVGGWVKPNDKNASEKLALFCSGDPRRRVSERLKSSNWRAAGLEILAKLKAQHVTVSYDNAINLEQHNNISS
jgi:hypothetical protein